MRSTRTTRSAAILTVIALSSGCYTYAPSGFDRLPPRSDVRVEFSDAAIARLREVGDFDSRQRLYDVTLVSTEPGRVLLNVPITRRQTGFYQAAVGQNVWFPTGEILSVEQRRLDGTRTALAVGGIGVAIGALISTLSVDAIRPVTPPPGTPGDSDEVLLP